MKLSIIYDYFANRYGSRAPEDIDIGDVDFQELLARDNKIVVIWSIEDVKSIRPDLSDEEAWEVLEQIGHKHDPEWGITWTTFKTVTDDMFPTKGEDHE